MGLVVLLVALVVVGLTVEDGSNELTTDRADAVRARVEAHVEAGQRRADALAVVDGIKAARVSQLEKQRALANGLDTILRSRKASQADFEKLFAEGDAARALAWENAVAQRERLKAHVHPDEWAKVFPMPATATAAPAPGR